MTDMWGSGDIPGVTSERARFESLEVVDEVVNIDSVMVVRFGRRWIPGILPIPRTENIGFTMDQERY